MEQQPTRPKERRRRAAITSCRLTEVHPRRDCHVLGGGTTKARDQFEHADDGWPRPAAGANDVRQLASSVRIAVASAGSVTRGTRRPLVGGSLSDLERRPIFHV